MVGGGAGEADPNTPVILNSFQHPSRGPALVHAKTRRGQRNPAPLLPPSLEGGAGGGCATPEAQRTLAARHKKYVSRRDRRGKERRRGVVPIAPSPLLSPSTSDGEGHHPQDGGGARSPPLQGEWYRRRWWRDRDRGIGVPPPTPQWFVV